MSRSAFSMPLRRAMTSALSSAIRIMTRMGLPRWNCIRRSTEIPESGGGGKRKGRYPSHGFRDAAGSARLATLAGERLLVQTPLRTRPRIEDGLVHLLPLGGREIRGRFGLDRLAVAVGHHEVGVLLLIVTRVDAIAVGIEHSKPVEHQNQFGRFLELRHPRELAIDRPVGVAAELAERPKFLLIDHHLRGGA